MGYTHGHGRMSQYAMSSGIQVEKFTRCSSGEGVDGRRTKDARRSQLA
jgi:hypothetical protein